VIVLKGRSNAIQKIADQILAMRGVELGKLVLTQSGSKHTTAKHSH